MIKKIRLVLLFLLFLQNAKAQIQIGSAEIPVMNNPGKLSKEDIEAFKKTTTVFSIQSADSAYIGDFENAIKKVWTITPFVVVTADKLRTYSKLGKYSFATFDGYATQRRNANTGMSTSTNTHISYDIWIPRIKNGEVKGQDLFARIALHCDFNTYAASNNLFSTFGNKKANEKFMKFMYNEAVFYNWSPGILMGNLHVVNQALLEGKTRGIFKFIKNKESLLLLAKDTLFVPNYVNIHFNMFNGNEKMDEEKESNSSKNNYPFVVQYLETKELSDKILNSSKKFYYLVYVKSSTDKFVSVYTSDGNEIYSDYTEISYNFKSKDLKAIAKMID